MCTCQNHLLFYIHSLVRFKTTFLLIFEGGKFCLANAEYSRQCLHTNLNPGLRCDYCDCTNLVFSVPSIVSILEESNVLLNDHHISYKPLYMLPSYIKIELCILCLAVLLILWYVHYIILHLCHIGNFF